MAYQPTQPYRRPIGSPLFGGSLLSILFIFVLVSVAQDAFEFLGFPPLLATGVLFLSILTSSVNIPLFELRGKTRYQESIPIEFFGIRYNIPGRLIQNRTMIAINVGGAILPLAIAGGLLFLYPAAIIRTIPAVIIGSLVINRFAKPIPGVGIAVRSYIPAGTTLLLTLLFSMGATELAAVIAYSTGVLSTLIGADILNLRKIPDMGSEKGSIGGAGTFDGVFLSGVLSVVLLSFFGII